MCNLSDPSQQQLMKVMGILLVYIVKIVCAQTTAGGSSTWLNFSPRKPWIDIPVGEVEIHALKLYK